MYLEGLSKSQKLPKEKGKHFDLVHCGKFADLVKLFEPANHPLTDKPIAGEFFLKDQINLTGMQVSFGTMPAGAAVPFNHKHRHNEELYIFIGGDGQIQIDGHTFSVHEGTAVRVSPEGKRSWRNTGSTNLNYIVIQAKENSLGKDIEDGKPCHSQPKWE